MKERTTADEGRERCETCRFWARAERGSLFNYEAAPPYMSDELPENHEHAVLFGECKRNPPSIVELAIRDSAGSVSRNHQTVLPAHAGSLVLSASLWPGTWDADWCGEWQPKKL